MNAPPLTCDQETARRLARLKFVLEKSAVYTGILHQRMEEDKKKLLAAQQAKKAKSDNTRKGKKRGRAHHEDHEDAQGKRLKGENGEPIPVDADADNHLVFEQPALVTGAKLKKYQLEGLQWMVSLDQNGISGILADEMGLGKTLQTIAFTAYLRECHNTRPILIVCPLSVLHNWHDEYQKFAPSIPVCIYHGTPTERAELRRTVMATPDVRAAEKSKVKKSKSKSKGKGRPKASLSSARGSKKGKATNPVVIDDSEEEQEEDPNASFPIVLTTYEMIIKDRTHLSKYGWGYIVVDEGHRLKNLNCTLMREIKKYPSAGRMILTGTPLHNNLAELWSLMNFILPDIFDDLDSFQEWFNLPTLQSALPTDQSTQIISALHAILKPFLLRRMKVDVLVADENGQGGIPPKKEYVLYAPLSVRQKEAYQNVLNGNIRRWLLAGGTTKGGAKHMPKKEDDDDEPQEKGSTSPRRLRKCKGKKSYAVDGSDDEYFEMVEKGMVDERGVQRQVSRQEEEEEQRHAALEFQAKAKAKAVNNMKLQNTVMQLRKVCSHPFLFDWPIDPKTNEPVLGAELVNASGKMMVLDRLLRELLKRGHRVLVFSQFVTMLDIIEDWATDFMGWKICRIDGSSSPQERREQMNKFQQATKDSPKIFLLSTRAGGLGINLTAADTVIFYDQDWNPQMDAQAQDRAHRIGQTKPVLVYRLVSAHTIEDKILQRATDKKKLEALVIAKGKFKMPAAAASSGKQTSMVDMAADLLRLEGEKIDVVPDNEEGKERVLSDHHLNMLLDRSPEVFESRGLGWTSQEGTADGDRDHTEKAAFAVYEAPKDPGNDALAAMMGEDTAL
ncbi:SNF2-family ATP dependent chromatin remodeling factor snf21 [Macrolepiota fuliginosa MF-IS2]|uniref:SNF2-family ATP dependent chromatin remodeling factor snf21 n=1 Tax=Macrolepiota fuliginosa MF-IS2 TaxID=1400762 RepID=A0A9P6C4U6_9AGAR|nr:SNF2-family ATP dependent chromatin remodeling factor snf21 [Macrolepiota fuliginosa MF-IS2]